MFDYLTKFNQLSRELREKVSSPAVVDLVENLEKKYGVNLAAVVMKVMTKDIAVNGLAMRLAEEFKLDMLKAEQLAGELKEKVFSGVREYLGVEKVESEKLKVESGEKNISTSSFFFSPEDEEEIKQLIKETGAVAQAADNRARMEEKLNRLLGEIHINFGSSMLAERFRTVILTYLRGIRDRIETKQTLMKAFESGGLGFDADSVDKILKIADGPVRNLGVTGLKDIVPSGDMFLASLGPTTNGAHANLQHLYKKAGVRDVDYDFSALAAKLDISHELSAPKLSKNTLKEETAKKAVLSPVVKPKANFDAGVKLSAILPPPIEEKKSLNKAAGEEKIIRRPPEVARKVKMEDIKFVPRLMGPLDELKFMDLINFRRLDKDAAGAAAKVKGKIALLEEEDYGKRLQGIKSWRLSPVNKLYLEMGNESIGENKPINVIIGERKATGKEYLTVEEFEAVMDLNKSLRF